MSLIFFDGFETVGTETGLANEATVRPRIALRYDNYSAGGTPATTGFYLIDDRFSEGYAWNQGTNKANWLRIHTTDETDKEYVVGCWIHIPSTTDNSINIFGPMGNTIGSPDIHFSLYLEDRTDLLVYGLGTALNDTVEDVFTPGDWHHVEAKFKVNSTTGYVIIKIDGTQVFNETGIDTNDFYGNVVAVQFGGVDLSDSALTDSGEDYFAIDDVWVLKTEGGDPDDFLGDQVRIISMPPDGDDTTDWTPSTGLDHYVLIDENGADSSDYVETNTNNDVDMYTIDNPETGTPIHAFKIEVEAIDTATGSNSLDVRIDSNGTVVETNHNVTNTGSYDIFVHHQITDPDTGSAWTSSGVNSAKVGIEFIT